MYPGHCIISHLYLYSNRYLDSWVKWFVEDFLGYRLTQSLDRQCPSICNTPCALQGSSKFYRWDNFQYFLELLDNNSYPTASWKVSDLVPSLSLILLDQAGNYSTLQLGYTENITINIPQHESSPKRQFRLPSCPVQSIRVHSLDPRYHWHDQRESRVKNMQSPGAMGSHNTVTSSRM